MEIHMPEMETFEFMNLLRQSVCFIEYGAGGSTIAAGNQPNIQNVISVETDQKYISSVREQFPGDKSRLEGIYIDIGPTKRWGIPISPGDHFRKFPSYVLAPWKYADSRGLNPDFILVDGRFRAAAFLQSLLRARVGSAIFFDDYTERAHYHDVEVIMKPTKIVGRGAIFVLNSNYDKALAQDLLLEKIVDWR